MNDAFSTTLGALALFHFFILPIYVLTYILKTRQADQPILWPILISIIFWPIFSIGTVVLALKRFKEPHRPVAWVHLICAILMVAGSWWHNEREDELTKSMIAESQNALKLKQTWRPSDQGESYRLLTLISQAPVRVRKRLKASLNSLRAELKNTNPHPEFSFAWNVYVQSLMEEGPPRQKQKRSSENLSPQQSLCQGLDDAFKNEKSSATMGCVQDEDCEYHVWNSICGLAKSKSYSLNTLFRLREAQEKLSCPLPVYECIQAPKVRCRSNQCQTDP